VVRESIIPAEIALSDILVPQNGVTPEILRRLGQGDVRAHTNGAEWMGIGLNGDGSPHPSAPRARWPRALGGDGDTRFHPSGRPGLFGPFT